MKRVIGLALLLLSSNLLLSNTSFAADAGMELTVKTENGVAYLSGGIGAREEQAMKDLRKDYNLQLTFALTKTGEYLADVTVNIQDVSGKKVLEAMSPGPLFFAKLPPGKYKVSAKFHEKSLTQSTNIKQRGARDLHFYWEKE